jgi:hypothetical protein
MSTPNNEIKTVPLLNQTQIAEIKQCVFELQHHRKDVLKNRQEKMKFLPSIEKTYNENPTPSSKLNRSLARAHLCCLTHILNGNKLLAEQQLSRFRDKSFIMFEGLEDDPDQAIQIISHRGIIIEGNKGEENLRQMGGAMMRSLNALQNFINILC